MPAHQRLCLYLVLTIGHCCLGSTSISVTLSAYNLEADPPEKGVLEYTAKGDETPDDFRNTDSDEVKEDAHWDVCILKLPKHVRSIDPAPFGETLHQAMSSLSSSPDVQFHIIILNHEDSTISCQFVDRLSTSDYLLAMW